MRRSTWCRRCACSWKSMLAETSREPWFHLAFKHADELTREDKAEILARGVSGESRAVADASGRGFWELYDWSRAAGGAQALDHLRARDYMTLQLLSQLAWMEEEWFTKADLGDMPAGKPRERFHGKRQSGVAGQATGVARAGAAGLSREAAARGQIELSTTPYYHPILPLIWRFRHCARVAKPGTPLPRRAYRHPEDAREQLRRAKEYHERVFGAKPGGVVAERRIGVRPGNGDRGGGRVPVVRHG